MIQKLYPPERNRNVQEEEEGNQIECFCNKIKQYRHIATMYDKLASSQRVSRKAVRMDLDGFSAGQVLGVLLRGGRNVGQWGSAARLRLDRTWDCAMKVSSDWV